MPVIAEVSVAAAWITGGCAIVVAIIGGIFMLVAQRGRENRDYLRERIATLEKREENTLGPLADAIEQQQQTIAVISGFIGTLLDDMKYRQRRDAERGQP